jgi:hypothetical protein
MAAYFDNSKYLTGEDRRLAREAFLSMIRQINAYQAWLFVADRFRDVVVSVAELPSWFVFAVATCVAAWTPTPLAIKIACLLLSGLLILMVFALDLQSLDLDDPRSPGGDGHIRWSKRPRLRGATAGMAVAWLLFSAWLLFGAWSTLGVLAVAGMLLLAVTGTLVVAAAAVYVRVHIRSLRVRAAIYLIGIGGLSFVATQIERPRWPAWLALGTWSAVWASLALTVVLAGVLMLTYLFTSVVWNWKNRRYTVAELVQTLAWMGVSLADEELPEDARSVFSRASPTLAEVGKVEALEYVANLMEHFLPRQLRTHDPGGDRIIAERCRGMACAVRQLKLRLILNRTSPGELASLLVPAIPPVALGNWSKIAYADLEGHPAPGRWARPLHMLRGFTAAVAPLAVLLVLGAAVPGVPGMVLAPALPIAITWLFVSIITWIDPGNGERTSAVGDLLGGYHWGRQR